MEWGLSTHLFVYQKLDYKILGLIRSMGFSKIEVWGMRPHFDYMQKDEVEGLAYAIAKHGITIRSVHAPFYTHIRELVQGRTLSLASINPQVRKETLRHTEMLIDSMNILGAELLVVHAGDLNDNYSPIKLNNLRHSLEYLLHKIQAQGKKLALENIATPLSTTPQLLKLIESLDPDQVGICLDIGHARLNEDVGEAILNCGSRLMALHISDNDGISDLHLVPGEGVIDWQNVINMLLRTCYNNLLTLELRQHPENPQLTIKHIQSGLKRNFGLNFYADQENRH
jgi:sugar phosphate isomerase/epimerase